MLANLNQVSASTRASVKMESITRRGYCRMSVYLTQQQQTHGRSWVASVRGRQPRHNNKCYVRDNNRSAIIYVASLPAPCKWWRHCLGSPGRTVVL